MSARAARPLRSSLTLALLLSLPCATARAARLLCSSLMLALLLALPCAAARAGEPPAAPAAPPGNFASRGVGFGTGVGAGNAWVREGGSHLGFLMPSLSLSIPLSSFASLDIWLPAVNLVAGNLLGERPFVWLDVFARFHPISQLPGLYLAPGLGFQYLTVDERWSGVVLEVPVRLGYEISPSDRVGLAFAARPFVDWVFPLGTREGNLTWGFYLEFNVTFYTLKQR